MIKHIFRQKEFLFIIVLIAFLSSCTRISYFPSGNVQVGLASWYGQDFHGKVTSNKEIYNMYDMTAAHKSLPFHSFVKVTNLKNKKSVTVRINDRGPFIKGRIIDLSYAAARNLDMIVQGVVPVRVEIIKKVSPKKSSQKYFVLVGSFLIKDNAKVLLKNLQKKYRKVSISLYKTRGQIYQRVIINVKSLKEAEETLQKLHTDGYSALVFEEQ